MFLSCSMRKCKTGLIHTSGKAIFELIATEGAYVRDLQLVVEVREHFLYIIDDSKVPFCVCKYRYSTRAC
jgi:hypothetical protein